jgi:transposase
MKTDFNHEQFQKLFPDNLSCLEKIVNIQKLQNRKCTACNRKTTYYKLKDRNAYSCKHCRYQVHPLAGTIFERSSTPLQLWFYAMFLLTNNKLTIKQLQSRLGVTYKTAWRMKKLISELTSEEKIRRTKEGNSADKIFKWTLFNKLTFSVTEKEESV